MLGVPVVSGEVLMVWTLPTVPSPDADGWARGEVVLLTLPAPVAAGLSAMGKGTAELGSVLSVASRVSVAMEEVTLWPEIVLYPDPLSP